MICKVLQFKIITHEGIFKVYYYNSTYTLQKRFENIKLIIKIIIK